MIFRRLALLCPLLCTLLSGCDLGGEVDHDGQYGFFSPAGLPGTAARPLERLLVLEADGAVDRTLYYFFEGDLGEAGIGVEDLRGVASRFSRFEMRFGRPPESYALSDETEAERATLILRVDGEPTTLTEITSEELVETGASRFGVSDAAVRVYFGVRPSSADFTELELASQRGSLSYTPELAVATPDLARDADALRIEYGRLSNPDYVEVDLFQRIFRTSDDVELDASLFISLWPEWPTVATNEVLDSAFAQGCWSADEPLSVRVSQIARSYTASPASQPSDIAVIARRLDLARLAPEQWTRALTLPSLLPYCEGFTH